MANASTIAAVAQSSALPTRAVTVGLATAMQESELRNLDGGDHDSAGLFQQRPSQGWGSFDEVTDPVYASEAFFSALIAVERWQELPVTVAAQAVQRSAYPDAYQQHADEAKMLTAALTGRRGASLSCTVRAEDERDQKIDPTGLTPRATTLRTAMEDAWGTQSLGGFAPGGVTRAQPSAHNEGRAIDVFFEPYDSAQSRHEGWALAHWLVAHADRLDVGVIIYRDKIWSAARSPEGWRDYTSPVRRPQGPDAPPPRPRPRRGHLSQRHRGPRRRSGCGRWCYHNTSGNIRERDAMCDSGDRHMTREAERHGYRWWRWQRWSSHRPDHGVVGQAHRQAGCQAHAKLEAKAARGSGSRRRALAAADRGRAQLSVVIRRSRCGACTS